MFDQKTKRVVYAKQTRCSAKVKSNCPCDNAKKARIYDFEEMDADHVSAWSKGDVSSDKSSPLLCTTHNRAKGNR